MATTISVSEAFLADVKEEKPDGESYESFLRRRALEDSQLSESLVREVVREEVRREVREALENLR